TQCIARLPRHVLEKSHKALAMLLLFFKSHMTVNLDERMQLVSTHLVVVLSRGVIRALNPVHRDAVRTEHASYLGKHRILFCEVNVADDIKADNVVKSLICKGQV